MKSKLEQHLDKAFKLMAQYARETERARWERWRQELLRCRPYNYRATMTALLERGPDEQAQR